MNLLRDLSLPQLRALIDRLYAEEGALAKRYARLRAETEDPEGRAGITCSWVQERAVLSRQIVAAELEQQRRTRQGRTAAPRRAAA